MKPHDGHRKPPQCPFRLAAGKWKYRCRQPKGHGGEHLIGVPRYMPEMMWMPTEEE